MHDLPQEMLDKYTAMRAERLLPHWWNAIGPSWPGAWQHQSNGLRVIETINRECDERLWHHVSVSRAARLPGWDDLTLVRLDFIGSDRESYIVLPPESRYVRTHPFTLHFWCCLDAPDGVLPDFRHLGQV